MEVSSICLSLVSGGFETIPGTLVSCIGSLSTAEGQSFQEKAYASIKRHYPDIRDAWRNSYQSEKVSYLNAIIKEAGRYYTVSSMSLPRKTVSSINWNGATIPAKTMILINAQAANHGITVVYGQKLSLMLIRWQTKNTMARTPISSILTAG